MAIIELWLGINLRRLNRFDESLHYQRSSLQRQQKLYDLDESNIGDMNSLADSHLEIGWTFSESGNLSQAIKHLEKAITIYEKVVRVDPNNISAQRQITFTRLRLGEANEKAGNYQQAKQIYETAKRESEILNQKDTKNSEFRHDKAVCLLKLAGLKQNEKNIAIIQLNEAIKILEQLTTESPEHKQRLTDLEKAKKLHSKLT